MIFFSYGYGCCVFKHNIRGKRPEVLDGMPDSTNPLPPKFFTNPECPPNNMAKEPVEIAVAEDKGKL